MRATAFRSRFGVLVMLALLMASVSVVAQTANLPNQARAIAGESVIYEFSFGYPDGWRLIDLQGIAVGGGALASIAQRDGQPESLIALTIISAANVADAAANDRVFPFPVQAFNFDAETITESGREIAIRRGTLFDARATFIAAVRVGDGADYAVLQAAVPLDQLASSESAFLAILSSVGLETVRGAVADAGAAARLCNYEVTVTFVRVEVINAEEAGTGADFDFDGDQSRMTTGIGPVLDGGRVDTGLRQEFQHIWEADLTSGQIVADGSIGTLQRVVCEPEVGLEISLVEDDSTPFGRIDTRLGGRVVLPVITDGRPAEEDGSGEYAFTGNTQDGNFEYRVFYTLDYQPVTINAIDLTPTQPPTPTFTPSPTPLPSQTFTPAPTDPPTSTPTPTFDLTQAALDFVQTQTAFAITQTAFVATFTPSPAPTLDGQGEFFATQTAFAVTQNAFLTLAAPTVTPVPPTDVPKATEPPTATLLPTLTSSITFTPTATPTASQTFTPSATPTPSSTSTPTTTPTPTPTETPLPTLTPTPTAIVCPDSLPSRLYAGLVASVVPGGSPNRLRADASRTAVEIGLIGSGEPFNVIGGPRCADGFTWIEVEYQGISGWTAEGDGQVYWLEPVAARGTGFIAPTLDVSACIAIADGIVNQRNGPGTSFDQVGQMQSGDRLEIVGQRISTSGFLWWRLIDETWVREDTVTEAGDCAGIPGA